MNNKQLVRHMNFDVYVKKCWEVRNAKTDAEVIDAVRGAIRDLIFARDKGLITRTDQQIKQNIELLDVLFNDYLRRLHNA